MVFPLLRSFDFSQSNWKEDDFLYAASVRVPYRLTFEQAASCIHNEHAEERGDEYAYVSMVLREKAHAPATLETECSFTSYGAPLLILADDLTTLPDSRIQYGRHIEVVGWEKGINVWELYPDPDSPKGQHTTNLGRFEFPINGGTRFTLFTRVTPDGTLTVGAREGTRTCTFPCPARVSKDFYAGITACEGKNYFYKFSVSE